MARPLADPGERAPLAHARCAVTMRGLGQSGTVVSSPPAKRRRRPEAYRGKWSSGDGLHAGAQEPKSGGHDGAAHRGRHFCGGARADVEGALVRGRRSG
jgi:hypothetical protein